MSLELEPNPSGTEDSDNSDTEEDKVIDLRKAAL